MGKVVRVEVGRFDYDFIGEFKFFKPNSDGITTRPTILIRLTNEDGVQGWGQAVPVPSWTYETPETVETTLVSYLAEAILGADPSDISDVNYRMNKAISPACSTGQPLAKAAVDIACYDLSGRSTEQSVSEMFDTAKVDKLQLSWTINSTDMVIVEAQLEEGRVRGYENFNFKVGPPQSVEYDLALARTIKDFSPSGFVWADANTGYSTETALDILPKLRNAGVEVMESPLPPLNIRGYQALKKQGALPIFMDEGIIDHTILEEFITLEMLDGVTIKTARSGGIWKSRQIIELAKSSGLQVLGSGLTDPDISLAASLHLFAGLDCCLPYALNGPQYLANTLILNGLDWKGDIIEVPAGTGLGIEMKPEAEGYLTTVMEL